MKPAIFPPVPYDTAQAALSVFGRNNYYLVIGDQAEALFEGICLHAPLDSGHRQSHKLAILYLSTVFQHLEGLPDQQALDALRERVDWKYALHLSLKQAPLEASMLCDFRQTAALDRRVERNFQNLLERLSEIPQVALSPCLKQDHGQVIRRVCLISRLALVWRAMNQALAVLAVRQSKWLIAHTQPHWYERYGRDHKNPNLLGDRQAQEALAQAIGSDGYSILAAVASSGEKELADLSEIQSLRAIWSEQFEQETGNVIWRKEACGSCASRHSHRRTAPIGLES